MIKVDSSNPATIDVALCASRHEIPEAVNGAIFPEVINDPMDFCSLMDQIELELNPLLPTLRTVNVYVTGLTPALLQVINWCRVAGVTCYTYHYNRNSGRYNSLPMV